MDARRYEPVLDALIERGDDGMVALRSPAVGLWRSATTAGDLVRPGTTLGELEVLGTLYRVRAPLDAQGIVAEGEGELLGRRAVGHGDRLAVLDPNVGGAASREIERAAEAADATARGHLLRAPSSGRFYGRPGPGKPPFVSVGDVIAAGHTVCLLEVMKTFNRVVYGGAGLPERARVTRIAPAHEADLDAGAVILELEPA
jgi:acetyl-CoA carboxylase biotin carboxyl carrier protein